MSRTILCFGVGPHEELLEIALPTFEEFARRHDYDLLVADVQNQTRPPSWWKVPALLETFDAGYDEVLYLDADVVVVDPTENLDVPDRRWQALVEHHTGDGYVPNCGVWFCRRPMRTVLEAIWDMRDYVNHPWWEQGALCRMMGYHGRPLLPPSHKQVLFEHTHLLDPAWNVHRNDPRHVEHPRIQHATMWPDRAWVMRQWASATPAPVKKGAITHA